VREDKISSLDKKSGQMRAGDWWQAFPLPPFALNDGGAGD